MYWLVCTFFFFNDTATTEIYTLSLHDALPICLQRRRHGGVHERRGHRVGVEEDRKSTRLNSSHANISYAVFCLKKKKTNIAYQQTKNNKKPDLSNPLQTE